MTASGNSDTQLAQAFEATFASDLRSELAAFATGKPGPIAPGKSDAKSNEAFASKISTDVGLGNPAAGVKTVQVGSDASGACLVTIHASAPKLLGVADTQAKVKKILGTDCAVRVSE